LYNFIINYLLSEDLDAMISCNPYGLSWAG
jgi:hypothetical protein